MKPSITTLILIVLLSLSCKDNNPRNTKPVSAPKLVTPQSTTPPVRANQQNVSQTKVHHYICPKNCEGSGAENKGTCPLCGTAYVHNENYHKLPGAKPDEILEKNAPPKNAFGVWHFTCSKEGCEGGAGSEGPGPVCGEALAHNQSYHH